MARPRDRASRATRRGFTLLEVILALAILGVSLATIGEINSRAGRHAVEGAAETEAQILAQTLLDDALVHLDELAVVDRQSAAVSHGVNWVYSIDLQPGPLPGVQVISLVVEQDLDERMAPVSYRLVRWASAAAPPEEQLEESQALAELASAAGGAANGSSGGTGSADLEGNRGQPAGGGR